MNEWAIAVTSWFCTLIFCGIGIYSLKKKEPMHFWSFKTYIDKNTIKDVIAYNKENAIMWFTFGAVFFIIGIISLVGLVALSTTLMVISVLIGTPILIIVYKRIYKKYHIR